MCNQCQDEPEMFMNYCCKYGSFENEDNRKCTGVYQSEEKGKDWKPTALKKAEKEGIGMAVYENKPNCPDGKYVDSRNASHIKVLKNGNLSWGKTIIY